MSIEKTIAKMVTDGLNRPVSSAISNLCFPDNKPAAYGNKDGASKRKKKRSVQKYNPRFPLHTATLDSYNGVVRVERDVEGLETREQFTNDIARDGVVL